jgi:hypothetical protein
MITGNTHTKLVAAVVALLAVAAVGARSAQAKPDSWKLHYQTDAAAQLQASQPTNVLGSQLDRIVQPDAFERALIATEEESNRAAMDVYADLVQPQSGEAVYPDAFERAVNARLSGAGSTPDVRAPDSVQPQLHTDRPVATGDSGEPFDWGLFALLVGIGACIVAACGLALATRNRERVAHP